LKLNCRDFVEATKEYHNKKQIRSVIKSLKNKDNVVPTWKNISNKTEISHKTYNTPQTTELLIEWFFERGKLKGKNPIFINSDGGRLIYQSAKNNLLEIADKLKYGRIKYNNRHFIHYHGFRDCFATTLLPYVDKYKLESWMGHSHSSRDNSYYLQNADDKKTYKEVMKYLTI
jgi:integrase